MAKSVESLPLGHSPVCGMMLADDGAEVIRIDRPGGIDPLRQDQRRGILLRSRRSITPDLRQAEALDIVCSLAESADGINEGFRPGVAAHLGLGPDVLMQRNPKLAYGRMTGWGQHGPMSKKSEQTPLIGWLHTKVLRKSNGNQSMYC